MVTDDNMLTVNTGEGLYGVGAAQIDLATVRVARRSSVTARELLGEGIRRGLKVRAR